MQITAAPTEEECSACDIRHLCPVSKARAGTGLPGKEQMNRKKPKINSKSHWIRGKGDNLRSDLVNWDDIMEEVVVRKIEDLRTPQSSQGNADLSP